MSSYNNILKELDKVNETCESQIFVPSLQQDTTVKPINIKKQKDIIKSSIDPTATSITFNLCINKIIKECTGSSDILVSDKPAIIIAMRNENIGTTYKGSIEEVAVDVNLPDIIDKYRSVEFNTENTLMYKKKVSSGNITINLAIPTLDIDDKFMLACSHVVKSPKVGDMKQVSNNIGEMFVFEVAKFINSIQYKTTSPELSGDTQVNSIRFADIPAVQCIKLVEMLPVSVTQEIVKFISNCREYEEKFTAITVDGKELNLPLDASLFTLE
jgi:hypothetical protein